MKSVKIFIILIFYQVFPYSVGKLSEFGRIPNNSPERSSIRAGYPYSPTKPTIPSQGVPWPLPKFISFSPTNLTLDPISLRITTTSECPIISEAIQRYKEIILKESGRKSDHRNRISDRFSKNDAQFKILSISIDHPGDCDRYPFLGMNENYRLIVNESDTGVLQAPDIWGALRGLETFSQLIFLDPESEEDSDEFKMKIRTVQIEDEPRFEHRGVMLDTSRHFVSVNTMKKNIDLMAFAKFNVFHWHIVDDPSFPYDSGMYPDLKKGAFSKRHVYSAQNISAIVEYARLRGIRVIPEFDSPGHTLSWGVGQKDILTQCYSAGKPVNDYGVIDPSSPITFDFFLKLLTEISQRFPDRYVHLGGDEVFFDCWRSNTRVQEFMRSLNISKGRERKLEEYYMQRLVNLIQIAGRNKTDTSYLVWQEVFDNGVRLDPNAIVHVWKGDFSFEWGWELFKITFRKMRAILSTCWYLNYIQYGENWESYYKCDPHHFLGTPEQKSLVVGGEACMWGEHIDATNLLPTLWPRASVVGERLWSPESVDDPVSARPRLEEHRCRLVRRGYPASPITGPGYCQVEFD